MQNEARERKLPHVSLLRRREIEARIILPLFNECAEEMGQRKALEVIEKVVSSAAIDSGAQLAAEMGGRDLDHLANGIIAWTEEDALDISIAEQSTSAFAFDVTRCRFAELYRSLGIPPELGYVLSCSRDLAMLQGFNPGISLRRTQTIMEGASYCDFHYHIDPAD